MATPLISENFADVLEPGLAEVVVDAYAPLPQMRTSLFRVVPMETSYYKTSSIGGLGDFEVHNGKVNYDTLYQQFDVRFNPVPFSKGLEIERELLDDDLYNVIIDRAENMGIAAWRTFEKYAASVFNNAFTGTGTVTVGSINVQVNTEGDSLCSTTHTLGAQDTGTTQSNSGTLALSPTNVETTRRNMRKFRDDRNEKVSISPDTLVVPIDLEETGWTIISSAGKVDSAENNGNFHYGRYNLGVWDYIESTKQWFMCDSVMMKKELLWLDRIALEFAKDRQFDNFTARFAGYARFAFGWKDWRWIYGQNPA